ncbi:MAG: serine/threonine-protein kinase HipA [Rhodothermales bacterium]|jgi:serine/threonine-protein kinase HipA
MAKETAVAEIWIWDTYVGAVVELDDHRILFEYAPDFTARNWPLSPLRLPLRQGVFEFPDLLRKPAFNGLPGALADALPDSFGTAVMRSFYTARGEVEKSLSPVQHLLYVGSRAIGALEFRPAEALETRPGDQEALEVAALVADARRIIQGSADIAIPEIYRIGGSAGGMRPKAVVLWNPDSGEVRSAFAAKSPGDVPAILKFDGVGPDDGIGAPEHFNRVEAVYAQMAREAGLNVVDIRVLESADGHAHLVIPRFDVSGNAPLHQHTLGGLLHVDYNDVGASSYEEYLRTIQALGMPAAAVAEGYRRMLFNVLGVNQDDHVKNVSFHMDQNGRWALTPAYDVTFARGGRWTSAHQMRVAGKRSGITRQDLLDIARRFGVKGAPAMIEQTLDALAEWKDRARGAQVSPEAIEDIARALEERRRDVESGDARG